MLSTIGSEDGFQFSKFYDNKLNQNLDRLGATIGKDTPLYQSKEYQNMSIPQKLSTANMWWGDVLSGAGYTLGAIGTGVTSGLAYRALAKKLGAVGKIAQEGEALTTSLAASTGEAGDEGRSGGTEWYNKTLAEVTKKYQDLGQEVPKEVIDKLNSKKQQLENTIFLVNLPIIAGTNFLQFGKTMTNLKAEAKEVGKLGEQIGSKIEQTKPLNQFTKVEQTSFEKGLEKTGKVLAQPTEEGTQEQSQDIVQNVSQDFYTKKFNNQNTDILKSTLDALKQSYGTQQGWNSFVVGALSTLVSGGVSSGSALRQAFKSDDPEINNALDILNKHNPKEVFKELIKADNRSKEINKDLTTAAKNNDKFEFNNAQNDLLTSYTLSRLKTGQYQSLKDDLEEVKNLSPEEFEQTFGIKPEESNKQSVLQLVQDRISKTDNIAKAYEQIETNFGSLSDGNKERLIHASVTIDDVKERKQELYNDLLKITTKENSGLLVRFGENIMSNLPGSKKYEPITLNEDFKKELTKINPLRQNEINNLVSDIEKLNKRESDYFKLWHDITTNEKVRKENDKKDSILEPKVKVRKPLNLHHGATEGDIINANDGTAETSLTEKGREEITKIADQVKELGYKDGITSENNRSKESGKIITDKTGGTLTEIKELNPWDLGKDFTLTKDTKPFWDKEAEPYFVKHPDAISYTDKNNKVWNIAESFNQYKERTLKAKQIAEQSPDKFITNHSNNIRVWDAFDNSNQKWDTKAEDHYLANLDVNNKDILSKYQPEVTETEGLNEEEVNNTGLKPSDTIDEDSFTGNKKTSIHTTEVGFDDGTKLLYKFTSTHPDKEIKDYKLQVITKINNPKIYQELLDQDTKAKQFEEENKDHQGIWLIIIDKDNKPVKENNKYIASTISTSERIEKNEIITKDQKKAIKDLKDFRELLLKQTKDIYLSIQGKSKGYAQFEYTKDGLRQRHSIERFVPLNEITLELPTKTVAGERNRAQLSNGQIAYTGKLYALDKEGRSIDLIPRTVNEQEINILVELIRQRLGIDKKVNRPSDEIEKLIYFGIPTNIKEHTIGVKKDSNVLTIGTEELTKEQLQTEEGDRKLRVFLSKKYVNANNKKYDLNINEEFSGPITDNSQTPTKYKSYKDFLLAGENPMFATDLKAKEEIQFKQQYLHYDPNFKTFDLDKVKEEPKIEKPTDNEGNVIEETINFGNKEEILKEKPKRERKGRQTLDRLERLTKDKTKLEESEINWFKSTFPNIPIEKVQGLIENKSLGRFISSGKVLLSTEATVGTLKHEAFHVVTQLYLNKLEIKKLYDEAKESETNKLYKINKELDTSYISNITRNLNLQSNQPQTIFKNSEIKDFVYHISKDKIDTFNNNMT